MDETMARALANAIGGVATGPKEIGGLFDGVWFVGFSAPNGQFLAIEHDGAYLFASESTYLDFQGGAEFRESPVIDGAEWSSFGSPQAARELGRLLGGSWEFVGGGQVGSPNTGIWNALFTRADGHYVVITDDCCLIYPDRDAYVADDCSWVDCHNFYGE